MKLQKSKRLFTESVAAFFVLVYMYTAIMKLKDIPGFIGTMSRTPFIHSYANLLAGLIPGIEIAISIFIIIPATRFYGIVMATALIATFTLYIAYLMIALPKLPCSCGGIIQDLSWKGHLIVNISLTLAGLLSIRFYKEVIAINRNSRTPVEKSRRIHNEKFEI